MNRDSLGVEERTYKISLMLKERKEIWLSDNGRVRKLFNKSFILIHNEGYIASKNSENSSEMQHQVLHKARF